MDYRLLLKAKWKEIIDHPLIQQFLSNPKNQQLLRQVMEEPNEENAKKLDSEFKQFYQKIRIIKYISTMIRIFFSRRQTSQKAASFSAHTRSS